jgi:GNAT superfamily N-acetyltransferase
MITITDRPIPLSLLIRFVFESALEYPADADVDGRLACWQRGEGRWAIAWYDRTAAGVACLVTLDDGLYQGQSCLYWLEVLPPFQRQGIGRALLAWAAAQVGNEPLIVASTPQAAPFYRRCLAVWSEPTPNTFVVEGGGTQPRNTPLTARAVGTHPYH